MADPASVANTAEFAVTHTSLTLSVDFNIQTVFGRCRLTVNPCGSGGTTILLDVLSLDIAAVTALSPSGESHTCRFKVDRFTDFGERLSVELPVGVASNPFSLDVHYCASRGPALCWLNPQQTAGKEHPFVFTQGQACLNRSLFPCQDSPGSRATWSATLVLSKQYTAVMSAPILNAFEEGATTATGDDLACVIDLDAALYHPNQRSNLPRVDAASHHCFRYAMEMNVPSYLVAFAAGSLQSQRIGPRSRVWTEPVLLDKAAWEFGHRDITERYLKAAEELFGPYLWGTYDIVVLPPSFPFGGMENPTATFLNPMLLAGDQSLTDTVAHEIAHSWFGNLVGPTTWSHFWLNEGFTMFAQRAIHAKVYGEELCALETVTGRELLRATVRDYGADSSLTRLTVPLGQGVDPDETYNDTAYEKGYAFVSYLRECVKASRTHSGGSDGDAAFFQWLTAYAKDFAFQSITPTQVFEHFFTAFPELRGDWSAERWEMEEGAAAAEFSSQPCEVPTEDLNTCGTLPAWPADGVFVGEGGKKGLAYRPGYEFVQWLHRPGWPAYFPDLSAARNLIDPAAALAREWIASDSTTTPPTHGHFSQWPTFQQMLFLDILIQHAETSAESLAMALLEQAYCLGESTNAELRLRWSQLVVLCGYLPGLPSVLGFLKMTGKIKYVTPVFRALVGSGHDVVREFAVQAYGETRPTYHPASQSRVDSVFSKAGLAWA